MRQGYSNSVDDQRPMGWTIGMQHMLTLLSLVNYYIIFNPQSYVFVCLHIDIVLTEQITLTARLFTNII